LTYTAIVLLLILGIILLLLEFLVIPGTTIAGIGGLLCLGGGVYMAYQSHGANIGHIFLLGTIFFLVLMVYYSLKAGTWKKMSLRSEINSKVETVDETKVKVGDHGKTISRCNPIGKAMVNSEIFEAKSMGIFIDQNIEIEVLKVDRNQIIIKPINE
jgi:membrane-bound ClpP family serine protease